jgi:predicted NBD/HSP70 family sugar kinase
MIKVTNPKMLRRSNKTNILFKLQNEGGKSRLQLAKSMRLTAASISQLVKELIDKGFVVESGSMQRNITGRREVLLSINSARFGALGVNIEKDKTHISVCNYDKVVEERIFSTDELLINQTTENLIYEILGLYEKHKNALEIMGLGVGITGQVDEKGGISIDSHGILPCNYPLLGILKKHIDIDIRIINNVKAQARALISDREDNFMYVKHSPGIGCAIVVGGKVVEGYNSMAGELGHTIVERNGEKCQCGKRGCLETKLSEKAIKKQFFNKTGEEKSIDEIYNLYTLSSVAKSILDDCLTTLCLAIGNAATINDPKKIMLTGGLFFQNNLLNLFNKKMDELGFGKFYKIINVDNDKRIKAYAGARHILLEKLFEV